MHDWLRRNESRLVLVILGLGLGMRVIWLYINPFKRLKPHESEMWKAAVAFAKTGIVQDAYAPGSGISSHVGPAGTMLAGLVYRWFGVGSLLSESIMAVAAAVVATALFYMLYGLARELEIPRVPRLIALCIVALVPVNFFLEVVDFRIRETALSTLFATSGLVWILRMDRQKIVTKGEFIGFGILAGLTFLINPVLSLALYGGIGLVSLRHIVPKRWPAGLAILLCTFIAVNGAWVVRNYQVYDRVMISRGNFGLELAVSNHSEAVAPADARATFISRMEQIHPAFSAAALARLKTFPNDAAYFDSLGKEARLWISEHPSDFVRLSLRHVAELFFPPKWQWNLYNNSSKRSIAALQFTKAFITIFAIGMIIVGLYERPRAWMFVVMTVAFPTAVYMLLQPTLRYRYIFEGLFVFLAVALIWRLCTLLTSLVSARGQQ